VRIHGTYVVATATVDYSELKMPFGVGILADSPIELFFEEKGPRLETIDPERKVWQLRQAEVIGTVLYPTEEVLKYLDYSAPLSGQEVKAGVKPALIVDTLVDEVVAVANISELNPVTGNPRQYWGKVVEFDGYALGVNIRLKDVVEAIAQTEIPINVNMLAIGIADSPALGSQLAIIGLNNELLDKGGETIVGRFMFRVAVSEMPIKLVDIESADTAFFLLSREELPIKIPTEL
jgi:small nuclear ribonucleoprotein (snRNP)-like protein